MNKLIAGIAMSILSGGASAAITTQEVHYQADGIRMLGYLAWDDAQQGKRPGILVVHEWWGHNAYARKRAEQLASMGYTALAVDMYGEGKVASHPDQARGFMQEALARRESSLARFQAAEQLLRQHPTVDGANIAAIGYCFGGGVALDMARRGEPLKAVASFHGMLASGAPADTTTIKTHIFVANGALDSFISTQQIDTFKQEMAARHADYTFTNYPGAKHSFTNPDADALAERFGMDIGYNPQADRQSWKDMSAFLARAFAH